MPTKPTKVADGYHENMICRNCGYCCSLTPQLREFDIANIKKLGYFEEFFIKDCVDGKKYMKMHNSKCVFFISEEKDGKLNMGCGIYEQRPVACRLYPSYDHKIKECPNIGRDWKTAKDERFLKPIFSYKE